MHEPIGRPGPARQARAGNVLLHCVGAQGTASRAAPHPRTQPHGRVRSGATGVALRPMRLFHWSNAYLALLFLAVAVSPLLR